MVRTEVFGGPHLAAVHGPVDNLKDEVRPDYVQDKENGEKSIEKVVGWKHLDDLWRLYRGGVEDPRRVDAQARYDPHQSEACEQPVTRALVVRVLAHFGRLQ